jgi:hypothetical protein
MERATPSGHVSRASQMWAPSPMRSIRGLARHFSSHRPLGSRWTLFAIPALEVGAEDATL